MKKLTALLLALIMLTFAFASCNGGDNENASPEGKTFAHEKFEFEIKDKEIEDRLKDLLQEGQTLDDFFSARLANINMAETTFTFKDGKCYSSNTERGLAYELDGKKLTFEGMTNIEGVFLTYEDGKLVAESEIDGPLDSKVTVRAIYAEK